MVRVRWQRKAEIETGRGNDIFLTEPIAQVDIFAATATERKMRVFCAGLGIFSADRALELAHIMVPSVKGPIVIDNVNAASTLSNPPLNPP